MQIIGIDTSLNSTAVTVFDGSNFHFLSFRKNLDIDNIWNRSMKFVKMYNVIQRISKIFSTSEIQKLEDYVKMSSDVFNAIKKLLNTDLPVIVLMEGYSQRSVGQDHDLVCYGTLIRLKMYSFFGNLTIIPPKSLKKYVAQMTYPDNCEGKKNKVYRNNENIAGGSFTKHHMMLSLIHYNDLNELTKWCKLNWNDIKNKKAIPKPADDLVDSTLLCLIKLNNVV